MGHLLTHLSDFFSPWGTPCVCTPCVSTLPPTLPPLSTSVFVNPLCVYPPCMYPCVYPCVYPPCVPVFHANPRVYPGK